MHIKQDTQNIFFQCNSLNVKLFNSQLNEPKLLIKNGTKVTLKLLQDVVGNSIDETNSTHSLLLTNTERT